ncbi:MAG: hypothetical protein GYB65_10830 [Chloroflexi bacterium]|nr:hypothetical protein [Chloroflexota bacterium]
MSKKIGLYVSHHPDDHFAAEMLAHRLRQTGFFPWTKPDPGTLPLAGAVLALLSPSSQQADTIHQDISAAREYRLPVLVLQVRTSVIPTAWAEFDQIDLRRDVVGGFEHLELVLDRLLGLPQNLPPPPEQPEKPVTVWNGLFEGDGLTAEERVARLKEQQAAKEAALNPTCDELVPTTLARSVLLANVQEYLAKIGFRPVDASLDAPPNAHPATALAYTRGSVARAHLTQSARCVKTDISLTPLGQGQARYTYTIEIPPAWTLTPQENAVWRAEIAGLEAAIQGERINYGGLRRAVWSQLVTTAFQMALLYVILAGMLVGALALVLATVDIFSLGGLVNTLVVAAGVGLLVATIHSTIGFIWGR